MSIPFKKRETLRGWICLSHDREVGRNRPPALSWSSKIMKYGDISSKACRAAAYCLALGSTGWFVLSGGRIRI